MKNVLLGSLAVLLGVYCVTARVGSCLAQGTPAAAASMMLFDPAAAGAEKSIHPTSKQVSATVGSDGITMTLPVNVGFPGIVIKPATGETWDFSAYGHVEAKITNLGEKKSTINLQVELQEGQPPFSSDKLTLASGESKSIKVVLGYFYGQYSRKFVVADKAVGQVRFYTGKSPDEQKFRIEQVQVAGAAGEKVELPVVKTKIVPKPANGVLFDASNKIQDSKQLVGGKDGGKIACGAEGKTLEVEFSGGKEQSVTVKGSWNLNKCLQVKVKLKNVGQSELTPGVRVEDINLHSTQTVRAEGPLASGRMSSRVTLNMRCW